MNETRIVIEQQTPLQKQVFWVVFIIALAVIYWQWAVPIFLTGVITFGLYVHTTRQRARINQLLADADQQRNWYEQGDPRAVFGPEWEDPDEGSVG